MRLARNWLTELNYKLQPLFGTNSENGSSCQRRVFVGICRNLRGVPSMKTVQQFERLGASQRQNAYPGLSSVAHDLIANPPVSAAMTWRLSIARALSGDSRHRRRPPDHRAETTFLTARGMILLAKMKQTAA